MTRQTPLARFKTVLSGRASPARKAATIVELAPELPDAALAIMDRYLDGADPLVQVAIMDAYFEMTDDDYHEQDLIDILTKAARRKDEGEELYMAARLALGRIRHEPVDAWSEVRLEMVAAVAAPRRGRGGPRRTARRRAAKPAERESLTIIIHGTWAADGKWWRPGGDFFKYVRKELQRDDLYRGKDRFKWSGKNDDGRRREAATTLRGWLNRHPAAEVNVFAHSHGANVAMLATHGGAKFERLVMLSPPVRRDYFAKWDRVGEAFNIQASFDPVVAIARGGKWFRKRGVRRVKEIELKASGHSASHDPKVWRAERLASFIGIPWP